MSSIASSVGVLLVAALFTAAVVAATIVFVRSVRSHQPFFRSFRGWVRDIVDALFGL